MKRKSVTKTATKKTAKKVTTDYRILNSIEALPYDSGFMFDDEFVILTSKGKLQSTTSPFGEKHPVYYSSRASARKAISRLRNKSK